MEGQNLAASYGAKGLSKHAKTNQKGLVSLLGAHHGTHPPWHVHLLYADVIAACFLQVTAGCNRTESTALPKPMVLRELPPPFYNISSDAVCDRWKPYLLDAKPSRALKPPNVTKFEEDLVGAGKGWRQYVDSHGVPGYMINSLSSPENRVLSFKLKDIGESISERDRLLKVTFLHTYKNAGIVYVHGCGKPLSMHGNPLDALIPSFRKDKLSIPNIVSFVLRKDVEGSRCDRLPAESRTVAFEYRVHTPPSAELNRNRLLQKFKLLAVQLCSALGAE